MNINHKIENLKKNRRIDLRRFESHFNHPPIFSVIKLIHRLGSQLRNYLFMLSHFCFSQYLVFLTFLKNALNSNSPSGADYGSFPFRAVHVPSEWFIDMHHSWTILKERNRLEEQVSAGKLDPSKQFDFSEIYIFGKYENFVKRVSNINELLNTIQNFRTGWKYYILIGQLRRTNGRIEFSTNEKAHWKNATLRELKRPIQTLTQLLNLSRENHMIFLIIARYYVILMTSHMSMSHHFVILPWGRVII